MHPSRFNLSRWSIDHGSLTLFLIVVVILSGIYSYCTLGEREDPSFTFRVASLSVVWPGATAQNIQDRVINPIEESLQQLPKVRFIKTFASPGYAVLLLQLKDDVNANRIADLWYQMRKKISDLRSTLPNGVQGPFINDEFGDTYVSLYALSGPHLDYTQLKASADYIRDTLLTLPGIKKVDFIGTQQNALYVELLDKKISQLSITPDQVVNALQARSIISPEGVIRTANSLFFIRVNGEFHSLQDIRTVPISIGQRTIPLSDIAHIYMGFTDPPIFKMRFMGQDSLGIGIVMTDAQSVTHVSQMVHDCLQKMKPTLPPGLQVHTVVDQTTPVTAYIRGFFIKLVAALIIVLGVSFLSLGARAGIVITLSIPLVLALTFSSMKYLHIDFQKISLGALIISLGLLVDDAMISIEMILCKQEEGLDGLSAASFAYHHTAFPMLTGTLITMAGFLPLGLAKSAAGEYVFSLFAVVCISMILSWFVAVYFTPYLGYHLLSATPHQHKKIIHTPFQNQLRIFVTKCIEHKIAIIITTFLLLVAGVLCFRVIEKQFFPTSDRPEVIVDLWLAEGSSFDHTQAVAKQFEKILITTPTLASLIASYTSYIGGGAPRFYLPLDQQMQHTNLAEIVLESRSLAARNQLIPLLSHTIATQIPGIRYRIQILNSGPPVGWPLQISIKGYDTHTLQTLVHAVEQRIAIEPFIENLHDNWLESVPSISVVVNHQRAQELGVNTLLLKKMLQMVFSGTTVAYYFNGTNAIPIVMRFTPETMHHLSYLNQVLIPTYNKKWIPLANIAQLHYTTEPGILWKKNRLMSITVQADIVDANNLSATQNIFRDLEQIRNHLPTGYSITLDGLADESSRSQASIFTTLPLVLFIIFFLLMIQLRNFSQAVMVYATAPLGIIGAGFSLLITHQPFGFVSLLGIIALAGMIMRNSVILVDQIHRNMSTGLTLHAAIVESTVKRFRPIVLTAVAAIFSFIPLVFNLFWKPMAITMIGGLAVGTFLTISFLPALSFVCLREKIPQQNTV